jgi:hypothetical protein
VRILVLLMMTHRLPDVYLHVGGTHVHHLNYGIFLLVGVGAYLLFRRPTETALHFVAVLYGIGLALTFDEFGLWLHLGGPYWQRGSFDAIVVVATALALLAVAPTLRRFRTAHWATTIGLLLALVVFVLLLVDSLRIAGGMLLPRLQRLEALAPT